MARILASKTILGETLRVGTPSTAERGGKKLRARRVGPNSLAQEQKLHLQAMERLDREIPLPDEKTRGFVFRR